MADEGETSAAVPGRPRRLTHEELRRAQAQTLEAPRRRYGIAARILFRSLDMVYGKPLTLSKFKVLELIARNADFEDHAEHEYMNMVAENSDWDSTPFESSFADDFGHFASLADVFRQIGHESLRRASERGGAS